MRSDRGSAAIEMALVLPVLLIAFLAIVEFGNLMFTKLTLTNAAMMGARAGITVLSTSGAIAMAKSTAQASMESLPSDAFADAVVLLGPHRIQVDVDYSYVPITGSVLFNLLWGTAGGEWNLSEMAVMTF